MKKAALIFSGIITAICVFIGAAAPALSAAAEYPLVETLFNERNGLPTGEANDVLQTSDGYIWIGSYGGLIRYDGREFRNYSSEGILPSSSVRMLFEDSKGRLWIGTNDAGVFIWENDTLTKPAGQPSDSFLCVRGFAENAKGTVYACSNSGAAEIKDGVMTVYTAPSLEGKTVYSLGVDVYGRLWCADSSGGCAVLKNGEELCTLSADEWFEGGETVYSVTGGSDGSIWLGGSENHLVRLTFSGEGFGGDINTQIITFEKVSVINSLRETAGGTVAVSGLHGFAEVKGSEIIREISQEEGAASVNSSCIDYEGNLWLASTTLGVVRYTEGCFEPFEPGELSGLALNAVAVSGGKGYIGLDSGLVITGGGLSEGENEFKDSLSGARVRDVITDSKGRIWAASYSDSPVICYDPSDDSVTVYSEDNGLSGNRARVLMEMSDGSMAVGLQSGVCVISGGTVKESYTGLVYPAILSLLETADGGILAGSDGGGIYEITRGTGIDHGGLYEIKEGAVINHGFGEGLSEGVVLRMLADEESENCYFISAGSSLYYYDRNKWEFTKFTELKKEAGSIFDLYQRDGRLWLLQNSGILSADRANLLDGGDGDPVIYGFEYGLTGSLNANTRHALNGGKLYLATRDGACVFGFESPENNVPKGIINSVTVDGVTYEHPKTITVKSSVNRITVNYAALTFNDTAIYDCGYELTGFDSEEHAADNSGSVSYTNLPGGEYEFRLRIYDNSGRETVCGFKLIKEKKLTEKLWFKIGVIVFIVLITADTPMLLYGVKLRDSRRKQREYKDIVEQSLLTFADTIDAKDKYTSGHSTRVALYSKELARRIGMTEEQQENIYYVALLHDIGKIGVPDHILNKPGKLTPEEREVIQTHPKTGAEILENFTALEGISDGARYHHERYDGSGYCEGKAGKDIPLTARIIGVADTYDAMSSERCYRKPLSKEVIEAELKAAAGSQLDPEIVPHMLDMIEEGVAPYREPQKPEDKQ
ncbi:MAG: HD domain-containing protein [Oscillospiraceae bacterium]|nr:HD domain-containing protein [Oscillospiraceae bacterium]